VSQRAERQREDVSTQPSRRLVIAKFEFDVIDAQAHLGSMPGHVNMRFSAEDLVRLLDAEGVCFALTSSASSTTVSQAFGTREILAAAEAFPQRIGALVWINPYDPDWEQDADFAADHGAVGIKLHPMLDTYRVDFASLAGVFAFAQRRQLPICTHAETGEWSAENYAPLVEKFPDVDLILYHFNNRRPIPGILLAKRFPRVYVETCFVPREAIEIGLDVLDPAKILFGTDAPLFFDVGRRMPAFNDQLRTYHDCTRDVEELTRSSADRDLILAGNARRIFRLRI
jgi:predicted TIM-barrel fold metal-dependent hydrolase